MVQALRGLSLAVPRGQIVALLGSNGAGKSTTLKAISGLLTLEDGELESGTIRFNGHVHRSSLSRSNWCARACRHVMEGRRVFEDLTVEENLVAATYALTGRSQVPSPTLISVYSLLPPPARTPQGPGRLFVGRRTANAGHWPRPDRRSLSSFCWTSPRWA